MSGNHHRGSFRTEAEERVGREDQKAKGMFKAMLTAVGKFNDIGVQAVEAQRHCGQAAMP